VQPLHRQFVPRGIEQRAGIEAQRQAVATYLNGGNWRIVADLLGQLA
jgi:hypothetical protein